MAADEHSRTRGTDVVGGPAGAPTGATAATGPAPEVVESERRSAVHLSTAPQRRDRVRWSSVWAGIIVALSTFVLLELALFALGWLTLGDSGSSAGVMSGVLALVAFFLGGLTAGATAMWRGVSDGLLHGIVLWGLGVVGIIFLTLFGGGALLGSLAEALSQVASLQQQNLPDVELQQAAGEARSAASWAVLSLGLSLIAAALGGMAGAKMWPRERDTEASTLDVR